MAELTVPSIDFSTLGNLPQVYKQAQADELRKQTLASLGQGPLDAQSLKAAGVKLGDMGLLNLGVSADNTQYQHGRDTTLDARHDREYAQDLALRKAAAARAGEDKFSIQKVENPDGTTSFIRIKTTGGEGLIPTGLPTSAATPNNPFSGGGKFNGDQGKAAGFTDRMLQSEGVLSGVAPTPGEQGPISPGVQDQGADYLNDKLSRAKDAKVLGMGVPFANYSVPEARQKYDQAKADFINAQLRRESGAAIGASEFANADKQYFPVPGDSAAVIKQKAANRRVAVEAMGREGGGSYKPKLSFGQDGTLAPYGQTTTPVQAPAPIAQPATPAPPLRGQLVQGYRFKGGDPADQNNWVKAQ